MDLQKNMDFIPAGEPQEAGNDWHLLESPSPLGREILENIY